MTRLVVALTVVFATVATFAAQTPTTPTSATYVGSQACQRCHAPTYERWSKTRMANVVRDPKAHPDAVLPDFSKPDPLLTFKLSDVAFVYGSRWKQRYFTKVGDDYFPQPAQWDVTHRVWRPYFVQPNTDWWVPHYPADNMKRPTGPLCDGCHSVNYDVKTHSVTEWNVGCEKCHGPGSEHVRQPTARNIVNPAKLDFVRANDTCIQCHSQGQPLKNPIEGRYYDWPVGFQQGGNSEGLLEARGVHAGRDDVHAFRGWDGTQEPDAGERFRREPDVPPRRDVLQLPRRARHVEPRRSREVRAESLPDVPLTWIAERSARGDDRAAHASRGGQRRQRVHRLPHAENRADHRRRERAQPHVQVHHAER